MLIRLALLTALIGSAAWAKDTSSSYSSGATAQGVHDIGVEASVENGGVAIGADYEYRIKSELGLGGYLHYFPKSTRTDNPANGMFAIGAQAIAHYVANSIDAYAGPGLGFINVDSRAPNVNDSFTFGPRFALGLLYQINSNVAVGVEETGYWIWLNSDYNGMVMNDLAVKFRTSF